MLRDILDVLLPSWARDDEADGAFAYTLAALIDVQLRRLQSGLQARFPSLAGPSALTLIGQDRLIPRGRAETDAHYATRLSAWRYPRGHRVRGNVFALLEQIQSYFGGGFALWGIDRAGNKRMLSASGEVSSQSGLTWTWDSGVWTMYGGYKVYLPESYAWARQWIVIDGSAIFRAQPDFGDDALWGGSFGRPGYCIGIAGSSSDDWAAIYALMHGQHRWIPAGARAEWLVVSLDGTSPTPDATWEKWGVINDTGLKVLYEETRSADYRYVALRSELKDYPGDTDWAWGVLSDLGEIPPLWGVKMFVGDPTDFPLSITLPGGAAYAGDDLFPLTITLPDDGDLP
jgi:hypothetical protein